MILHVSPCRIPGSVGRGTAIREDELAAAANGINTVTTKLLAFALGATTSGLAGVFNASKLTIVSPDQFLFTVSFTVLAMVILGGMGNIWGVAVGRVHRLHHPGGGPQTDQRGHRDHRDPGLRPRASPRRPREDAVRRVPVPALRGRPGPHDAVATGRSLPEPAPAAGAARRRGHRRRGRRESPARLGAHAGGRAKSSGPRRERHPPSQRASPSGSAGSSPSTTSTSRSRRGHRQPHRAERRRQDDVLQHHRRHLRPDRGRDRVPRPQDDRPTATRLAGTRPVGHPGRDRRHPHAHPRSESQDDGVDHRRAPADDHRADGGNAHRVARPPIVPALPGQARHLPERPAERHGRRPASAGPSRTSACSRT